MEANIGSQLLQLIEWVRKEKSDHNLSMKAPIKEAIISGLDPDILDGFADDFKAVSSIETLQHGDASQWERCYSNEDKSLSLGLMIDHSDKAA